VKRKRLLAMNNTEEIVASILKLMAITMDMREDKHYSDHISYRRRKTNELNPEIARLVELLKTS
jgi:hypothetical protein